MCFSTFQLLFIFLASFIRNMCVGVAKLALVMYSGATLLFFFFFSPSQGFPQDLGFWPPRGTSQKKVKKFFFRALLCVVCSTNADVTLRASTHFKWSKIFFSPPA